MPDTEVLKAVQDRFAGVARYDTKDILIAERNSFLWGTMLTVSFGRTDGSRKTVWAWEVEKKEGENGSGEPIRIMEDAEAVVSFVSLLGSEIKNRIERRARGTFLAKFGPVEVISGAIALLLTLTIVFITGSQVLKGGPIIDPPALLANALTIILGFYFGRATTSSPPSTDSKSGG